MKQLVDSQGEIGELQRKLEDADGRNGLLQDSLQRVQQQQMLFTYQKGKSTIKRRNRSLKLKR
nr:unnamed protein product [Digitaria exilis]CAB3478109.1 unnamed protein product [Digitaria exilis]